MLLQDLAVVLGAAALASVVCRRLRLPPVLGYLVAGLLVGPHLPFRWVTDPGRIHTLSGLGVILVMFSVGLEFSVRRLARTLPTAGATGLVQLSTMWWLGWLAATLLGWTPLERAFTGAMLAASSTMVVTRVLADEGIEGRLRALVIGVLLVEDVAAILAIAALSALSRGTGLPAREVAVVASSLLVFLAAATAAGFLVVPRAVRAVARLHSPEALLLAGVGLCFALALLAEKAGFSVALGAFLAGSLIAESGEAVRVEHLVRPLRDTFAAVFFVAVGMSVDPATLAEHAGAIALLTAAVLLGQVLSVALGAFLSGHGLGTAIRAGMSLAQIGEFAFIVAGIGATSGATRRFLPEVAVAVAALTTLATPLLVRVSGPVAAGVVDRLPRPVTTFTALYTSWLDQVRAGGRRWFEEGRTRRLARLLLLDAACLGLLVVGTALSFDRLAAGAAGAMGLPLAVARAAVATGAVAAALPFVAGAVRVAGRLGAVVAARAIPEAGAGDVDLGRAPRRVLVVALQVLFTLLVGAPLVALTQPFVPAPWGAVGLVVALVGAGVGFWRSATDLEEHVRAGAQMVVEALLKRADPGEEPLTSVQALLPGLGMLSTVPVGPGSPAVGRSLAELDLPGRTGCTIIAIRRGDEGVAVPTGGEVLRPGDLVALTGSREAVDAARAVLVAAGQT